MQRKCTRTVARKLSIGGFRVCSGGLDILKFDKNYRTYNSPLFILGDQAPIATGLMRTLWLCFLPIIVSWKSLQTLETSTVNKWLLSDELSKALSLVTEIAYYSQPRLIPIFITWWYECFLIFLIKFFGLSGFFNTDLRHFRMKCVLVTPRYFDFSVLPTTGRTEQIRTQGRGSGKELRAMET